MVRDEEGRSKFTRGLFFGITVPTFLGVTVRRIVIKSINQEIKLFKRIRETLIVGFFEIDDKITRCNSLSEILEIQFFLYSDMLYN